MVTGKPPRFQPRSMKIKMSEMGDGNITPTSIQGATIAK